MVDIMKSVIAFVVNSGLQYCKVFHSLFVIQSLDEAVFTVDGPVVFDNRQTFADSGELQDTLTDS